MTTEERRVLEEAATTVKDYPARHQLVRRLPQGSTAPATESAIPNHKACFGVRRPIGSGRWAVRRIIPPLLNDFIGLQKDTALLAFVGVLEIFNTSTLLKSKYFNLTPVVAAGIAFVIITIPLARLTDYLVRRDQARMRANG